MNHKTQSPRTMYHLPPSARLAVGAVLSLSLGAHVSAVAPASSAAATASAASAPKLMTRDQLRDCMGRRTQVRAESDLVAAQKDQIDKDQTALQAALEALKQRAAAVDRKKQADIDAYNAETAARNLDINQLDERIGVLNTRAASLRTSQEAYTQDCVSRSYDERDRAALEKEQH